MAEIRKREQEREREKGMDRWVKEHKGIDWSNEE